MASTVINHLISLLEKVLGNSSARIKRVQKNVNYISRWIEKSAEFSYTMFVIFKCIYKKEFPMNSNNWLHNQTYITNVIKIYIAVSQAWIYPLLILSSHILMNMYVKIMTLLNSIMYWGILFVMFNMHT